MLSKCKVTVMRRGLDEELIAEYLDAKYADMDRCDNFREGQEFVIDKAFSIPEGFCPSAWASIRHTILRVASGGDMPGFKEPGTEIDSCHDWFRPVMFRIERIDD